MKICITDQMLGTLRDNRLFFENDLGFYRLKVGDYITFSDNVLVEPYCGILSGFSIPTIGSFSYSWSPLHQDMIIGRYCSIGEGLVIPGYRHPVEYLSTSSFVYDKDFSIIQSFLNDQGNAQYDNFYHGTQKALPTIGNDVWVGANVTIMPGVSLADGCAIAAGSVVTKDVPNFAIVGGNPAKLIPYRFDKKTMDRLLEINWWRYCFTQFAEFDLTNIPHFIESFVPDELSHYTP